MDRESEILNDAQESDASFREQFDPKNPNYHGGDRRPVPVGGSRVPESMAAEYPSEPVQEVIPDDPQYHAVLNARALLQEFKKVAAQVLPSLEAKLRAKSLKDETKKQESLNEANRRLHEVLAEFRSYKERLAAHSPILDTYDLQIEETIQGAVLEYETKEEYGDFMLKTGIFTKKVFKDIQDLLQRLKEIKKAAAK